MLALFLPKANVSMMFIPGNRKITRDLTSKSFGRIILFLIMCEGGGL